MPWFDCAFASVVAPDRETAARLGRVPVEAVRGPYASLEEVETAARLRKAAETERRRQRVAARNGG